MPNCWGRTNGLKKQLQIFNRFVKNRLNISDFIKLFTPNMKKNYLSELIIPSELVQNIWKRKKKKGKRKKLMKYGKN